jgi:hypothetical protein
MVRTQSLFESCGVKGSVYLIRAIFFQATERKDAEVVFVTATSSQIKNSNKSVEELNCTCYGHSAWRFLLISHQLHQSYSLSRNPTPQLLLARMARPGDYIRSGSFNHSSCFTSSRALCLFTGTPYATYPPPPTSFLFQRSLGLYAFCCSICYST